MKIAVSVLIALVCVQAALALPFPRTHYDMMVSSLKTEGLDDLPKQFFTQTLDHYDSENNATFQQKYYVNDQYWDKENGPVFLMIGGEGPENGAFLQVGAIAYYAKQYNALLVDIEHRFYGESFPASGVDTPNLRFLSSQQALADLDTLQSFLQSKYGMTDANKWVCFGGSYPGALSAWYRLKYPHKVVGAISSSAPVQAVNDFSAYLQVVQASLTTMGGQSCVPKIAMGVNQITSLYGTDAGRTQLQNQFKTCDALKDDSASRATFMSAIAGLFMGVVQYNRDIPSSNITISALCDIMGAGDDAVAQLAAVNELLLQGQPCLDVSYASQVNQLKNTSTANPGATAMRLWIWQSCREFGFFQSSDADSSSQPFGDQFPIEYWNQMCADVYGDAFRMPHVDFTNDYYGGKMLGSSNTVMVNGLIDPWHALSITTPPANKNLQLVIIPQGAHCSNMYYPASTDSTALQSAHKTIQAALGQFLA